MITRMCTFLQHSKARLCSSNSRAYTSEDKLSVALMEVRKKKLSIRKHTSVRDVRAGEAYNCPAVDTSRARDSHKYGYHP